MSRKTITVFKGDGIGPEITDAVLEVLEAAFRSRPVIGADLCGENPLDMEDGEQLLKADSLNEKLLGALKRWMGN